MKTKSDFLTFECFNSFLTRLAGTENEAHKRDPNQKSKRLVCALLIYFNIAAAL